MSNTRLTATVQCDRCDDTGTFELPQGKAYSVGGIEHEATFEGWMKIVFLSDGLLGTHLVCKTCRSEVEPWLASKSKKLQEA